jgi:hypothetical protein
MRRLNDSDQLIAETITTQLGGRQRIRAMVGECYIIESGLAIHFARGLRAHRRINRINVTLLPADEYLVEFWSVSMAAGRCHKVAAVSGVQLSELRATVERTTGLALSLGT